MANTQERIKKMHEAEKAKIVEKCKEAFKQDNPDREWSDEEIEEACESIREVNEMFSMISMATHIDTSSMTVELGSESEGHDADVDTGDENKNDDEVQVIATISPKERSRSRPPKRQKRTADRSWHPPRSKSTLEWLAEKPNRYNLRINDRSPSPVLPVPEVQPQPSTSQATPAFDFRMPVRPRRLDYPDSSTESDSPRETSTPKKMPRRNEESSDEGPSGPRGLADPTLEFTSDDNYEEEIAYESSTGDTLNDDISDCRFGSENESQAETENPPATASIPETPASPKPSTTSGSSSSGVGGIICTSGTESKYVAAWISNALLLF